ncbi:MAG: Gfo/Idh/MocA family oxidoreductase [Candidatus Eisenbacteria bacterium]
MSNRTIGVGILGTGFARSTQIPCFQATPGFEVVGLVSRNMTRAYDLAKEFELRRAFDDLERMLAVPEIELVAVSTPPHMHLPHTLAALRAGKHVLCEKPTALHAGEAAEMYSAAKASGKIHLIDHELRFNPRRRRLAELVKEGFLGHIYTIDYRMAGAFRVDPTRPWSWWSDESQGGGVLGALGSHAVDAIRSWVGEIKDARGLLKTMIAQRPDPETGGPRAVTSDDYAVAWLRLENGGEVNLSLSAVSREEPWTRVALHGEKGSLLLDEHQRLWKRAHGDDGYVEVPVEDAPLPPPGSRVPDSPWARAFLLYAAAIRDAIRNDQATVPGAATFEDGLKNQLVLDAIRESSKRGNWVAVDSMLARA